MPLTRQSFTRFAFGAALSLLPTAQVRACSIATPHPFNRASPAYADLCDHGAASTHHFLWPAHGNIIAGFCEPTTAGIDLALPTGTPVRAAEAGVVAYAGNELGSYGNLILIRHPNGFLTAYAHTSEILVKRNDPVKRGQVIARSGTTGAVAMPQLHFELRKDGIPVDPRTYLICR